MSPEQLRDDIIDVRSDIYSFGVVLFEMVTGQCPFLDPVPASLIHAILNRSPASPCSLNPAVSPGLERVILKALDKDPECRYQSAREIRVDLQRLTRGSESGSASLSSRETAPLAATLKRRGWAFTLTALLILAFIAGVVLLHRSRAHVLSSTDTVILADFANSTGNAVFDEALKQALTVSLRQSPFLNVLSDEKIGATLRLMTRPASTPLTPELAREVCERAGSKAYIAGTIATLGNEFVLSLRAQSCQTGDTLALEQMQAAKTEKVLEVLGSAAARLRTELGESLSSVQRFGTPIAQATTPSFEGLKAYSLGIKNWNENGEAEAIPFFRQAIELDPNFAMAYAYLGLMYGVIGEQSKSVENLTKSFQLRDRVTEAEKFFISSSYYFIATGELEKSIQVNDMWAQAYPRDPNPHLSTGGSYALLGQYEKAVEETRKCLGLDPDHAVCGANLIQFYALLSRFDEAQSTYEETIRRNPDFAALHAYRYGLAFLQGNTSEMEKQAKWALDKPGWGDVFLSYQSDTAAFSGHLHEARELSKRAVESAQRNGQKETAVLWEMNQALREAEFGNSNQALQASTPTLKVVSTRGLQILVALALARAGDSTRAERAADELERQFPLDSIINKYWLPTLRASIQMNRHNASQAIEFTNAAAPYELGLASNLEFGALLYPAYVRGQAYLVLHRGPEAVAEFQKFIDHRALVANSPLSVLARVGLARAYRLSGDKKKARAAYQDFLVLWKDCDPDIPVAQEAKAELATLE
jgi:tetratricopeptide (TPR) repeat protein